MLLLLIEFLSYHGVKVPAAFYFSSTRMILAALTSLLFTIFLGPPFIKKLYELKIGQSIRSQQECPVLAQLHEKKKDTPTMGGILILSAMVLSLFLWMDLRSSFTIILLMTTVWLGFMGGYDDYLKLKYKNSKGLSGKKKLFFQFLLGSLVAVYLLWPAATKALHHGIWLEPPVAKEEIQRVEGSSKIEYVANTLTTQEYITQYYMPFYKDPVFVLSGAGLIVAFLFILFVVTGSSNAVNLTDGLDGLAAGCLIMVSVVLGLFAFVSNNIELSRYLNVLYIEDSGEIAIYLFALTGACMGFLWFNGYPAQVFMGDTGSLSLGGVLGVSAILLRREFLLAIIGGIFVVEALSVILQVGSYKLRNKKRIFLCAPLHHHFEYKGWPETKVVLRFWIVSLVLAMIGIASLKFQ